MISSYRAHLPSTEEIFMHPDLEKGKPFTVGGWIGRAYNDSVIMIGNRFHCKTENMGITTTFVVVVMLSFVFCLLQ